MPITKPIFIPTKIDVNSNALLDTGSMHNYVSNKIISNIQNAKRFPTDGQIVEMANGANVAVHDTFELQLSIYEEYRQKLMITFMFYPV